MDVPARLVVDVTTAWAEAGRAPHGTTRVVGGIARELAHRNLHGVEFVRFDRTGPPIPLMATELLAALATPQRSEAGRVLRSTWSVAIRERGKLVERAFRARLRDPIRARLAPVAPGPRGADILPANAQTGNPAGAIFLSTGEHNRIGLQRLHAIRRSGARLAMIFYDMLDTLPDGDPLLSGPDPTVLPGTDFMAREADLLLPISAYSRDAILAHIRRRGWPEPPSHVIRLAGKVNADPRGDVPSEPFVIAVGDIGARKNQAMLLRVWKRLLASGRKPPLLVLIGRVVSGEDADIRGLLASADLAARVRIEPNLDDRALAAHYRACRFTLFASRIEGFGLPVAESLSCGKLCVASSAAAIPEAAQGLGTLLDPLDEDAWFSALAALYDDPSLIAAHEAEIALGFRPAGWAETVDDILAAVHAAGSAEAGAQPPQ